MCGIAGILGAAADPIAAGRMAEAISSRGPDDSGVWHENGIALSHRRLSILDLSAAGHQPMESACGRFVLVLNGEIYNWQELRKALDSGGVGPAWRGHSDTEVLLAAIAAWGVKQALGRLRGMFAFAVWDRVRRELTLARDRLGEKPLYYGWNSGLFLFGSELKAIAAWPGWRGAVDRGALALFMRYGYIPAPHTIWQGIRKLLPGSSLTLPMAASPGNVSEPVAYWRAADIARMDSESSRSDAEAIDELERRLKDAVAGQMIADVPLGAFLSGGIDSSVVVAMMQSVSSRPVRSFSVGFAESDYDEAAFARQVAHHLGTEHTEFRLTPEQAMAVIPQLPMMFDEPFADSSQIPTHLVAALARKHVAVCLSGDAGDELFGGYNRYFWGRRIWRRIGGVPRGIRRLAGLGIRSLSPATWDRAGHALPRSLRQPTLGDRLHKLASVIDVADSDSLYRNLVSQHRERHSIVMDAVEPPIWADAEAACFAASPRGADFTERMMFHDLVGYMTDDILCKVDRSAMAVSLETRVPLLDDRLVEFAWTLPLSQKLRDGQGKWLLRQVLYRHVPRQYFDRPKQGFGIPLDSWLRGPLRDWAEGLMDEARLRREGWLHPAPIRRKWEEHLSGRRNWQYWLWNVLMFQAWQESWL